MNKEQQIEILEKFLEPKFLREVENFETYDDNKLLYDLYTMCNDGYLEYSSVSNEPFNVGCYDGQNMTCTIVAPDLRLETTYKGGIKLKQLKGIPMEEKKEKPIVKKTTAWSIFGTVQQQSESDKSEQKMEVEKSSGIFGTIGSLLKKVVGK